MQEPSDIRDKTLLFKQPLRPLNDDEIKAEKPPSLLDPERSGNAYQRECTPARRRECWLARTAGTMRKRADGGKKNKTKPKQQKKKKNRETELQPVTAVAALC